MEFFNSLLFIYLKSRTFVSLTVEHLLEFSHFAKWTSTYNRRQNYLSSKKFFAICSVTRHTLARKRHPFSFLHSLRRRKRRPLNRCLIWRSLLQLFWNFDHWQLIRGWLLNVGSTVCSEYSWLATTWSGGHVGGVFVVNTIFSRRIYMKIGFSSQGREMLLFLTRVQRKFFLQLGIRASWS